MKLLKWTLSLVLVAVSANSWAFQPRKGDFTVTQVKGFGRTSQTTVRIENIDQKKDTVTISVTSTQAENDELPGKFDEEGDVVREGYITDIKTECRNNIIGTLENVTTPAGTFLACKKALYVLQGDAYVTEWHAANVPFGVVKSITQNSDRSVIEQVLLKYGNRP